MNGTVVESTTLAAIAYDEGREILELEFRGQEVYRYFGVPGSVHKALLCAASKGRYFNEAIRGQFPYARSARAQTGEA
jgi:KTSC domain